jgi:hypothetical protein
MTGHPWAGLGGLEYVVRGSHRDLVLPMPSAQRERGIVVVPVSRPEPVLETAVAVADELEWPLLLLCSRNMDAFRVRELVAVYTRKIAVAAANLLHGDFLHGPRPWRCPEHPAAAERIDVDTNRKRNLGLAAARMTGHLWVLFMDDDVTDLTATQVKRALGHLRTDRTVASWPCQVFPDNSVVHHARRDFLGLEQDVFLTGGALLVRVDGWSPPGFPPMYNEDWLFLFQPIQQNRVLIGPDIRQLTYDPYDSPGRAREQEFGDVLGEGLYHLLHEKLPVEFAFEADYWRSVHAKRTKLIQMIIAELRRRLAVVATETEHDRLTRALAAILESRSQLTRATPESLADFVVRWQDDEKLWQEFLAHLPKRDTLKEALVYLGLHESWIVTS